MPPETNTSMQEEITLLPHITYFPETKVFTQEETIIMITSYMFSLGAHK